MVQGEKFASNQSGSTFGNQMEKSDSSKRNGFQALQRKISENKTTASTTTNKNSSSNWGPFKSREDFVNHHFC